MSTQSGKNPPSTPRRRGSSRPSAPVKNSRLTEPSVKEKYGSASSYNEIQTAYQPFQGQQYPQESYFSIYGSMPNSSPGSPISSSVGSSITPREGFYNEQNVERSPPITPPDQGITPFINAPPPPTANRILTKTESETSTRYSRYERYPRYPRSGQWM